MIAHGHGFDEILQMTLGQLRGFLRAIDRAEATRELRLLNLVLLGTRGEAKAIERLEDTLRKQADLG
ncbi:MAG: hypothetical protein IPG16_22680 [Comamonadaceae bacterium]|nr:hypothetical protein [Comamonadaceae bacterium]